MVYKSPRIHITENSALAKEKRLLNVFFLALEILHCQSYNNNTNNNNNQI